MVGSVRFWRFWAALLMWGWGQAALAAADLDVLRGLADQGDPRAQERLGEAFAYGDGVEQDDDQAAIWFRQAADQGNVLAQHNLAQFYDEGRGVKLDRSMALFWYLQAAEKGYAPSQFALGTRYLHDDTALGLSWLRRAAQQGHRQAIGQLAFLYDRGVLLERNLVLAYAYNKILVDRGERERALVDKEALARQLTPVQVREGDRLAKGWKQGTPLPSESQSWKQR